MNKEQIQSYIKLIKNTGTNEPLKEAMVSFLETYDGNNEKELNVLVLALVMILMRIDDLEIKEEAFEALQIDKEMFDRDIKDVKRKYNELTSNKIPDFPTSTEATTTQE